MPCKYDYGCGKDFPIEKMSFYKNGLNLDLVKCVKECEYGLAKP